MNPAMDVSIVLFVVIPQGIEHSRGLLRGGGVVEVNQRMSVNLLVQDRKLPAQTFPIDGLHQYSPSCRRAASLIMLWCQGGSQTTSTFASSTPSIINNLFCTSCASTGPMPQPGAVSVIFTSARWLFSARGAILQS